MTNFDTFSACDVTEFRNKNLKKKKSWCKERIWNSAYFCVVSYSGMQILQWICQQVSTIRCLRGYLQRFEFSRQNWCLPALRCSS